MLTLTESAAATIRRLAEETAPGAVLRIGIQGGGCNGFEYVFDFETVAGPADLRVEQHGVTVVVDPDSAPYLEGAEIDFVNSFAETGLSVRNPNVVASCGCGSSFQAREGFDDPPQVA